MPRRGISGTAAAPSRAPAAAGAARAGAGAVLALRGGSGDGAEVCVGTPWRELILPPPGGGPYLATISGGAMSAFLLMSPVNVKGILSSSTQMYSGSLGTSPKRGFLIKSQRVSAGLIATDGSPGDGTPSAWRTLAQPESARTSASHSVRRCFVPRPITAHKIAHTFYSLASHGGAPAPRRAAARPAYSLASHGGGLGHRLASPAAAARPAAPRRAAARPAYSLASHGGGLGHRLASPAAAARPAAPRRAAARPARQSSTGGSHGKRCSSAAAGGTRGWRREKRAVPVTAEIHVVSR